MGIFALSSWAPQSYHADWWGRPRYLRCVFRLHFDTYFPHFSYQHTTIDEFYIHFYFQGRFIICLWLTNNRNHFITHFIFILENIYVIHVYALPLILPEKKFGLFGTNVFCIPHTSCLYLIYIVNSAFSSIYVYYFLRAITPLLWLLAFSVRAYDLHQNVHNFEFSGEHSNNAVCGAHISTNGVAVLFIR